LLRGPPAFLKDELAAELEFAGIVGAGYVSEVAIGEARVDGVELSVVEGVKGFGAKFQMRILVAAEGDTLE